MRRRIMTRNRAVVATADDFTVFNDDCTHRDFTYRFSLLRLREGESHKVFVAFNQDFANALIF